MAKSSLRLLSSRASRPSRSLSQGCEAWCCAKSQIFPETLLVSAKGGVKNGVVWLEGVKGDKPWPVSSGILDQQACVFLPHVQVVAGGTTDSVGGILSTTGFSVVTAGLPGGSSDQAAKACIVNATAKIATENIFPMSPPVPAEMSFPKGEAKLAFNEQEKYHFGCGVSTARARKSKKKGKKKEQAYGI